MRRVIISILIGLLGCDGDPAADPFFSACDDTAGCDVPSGRMQPAVFRFPVGVSDVTREVALTNLGSAPLKIRSVQMQLPPTTTGTLSMRLEDANGVTQRVAAVPHGAMEEVVDVPTGHRLIWMLSLPSPSIGPGTLGFETNDPERRRMLIPIVIDAPARLSVDPPHFQMQPAAASTVSVFNAGGEGILSGFEVDGPYQLDVENGAPLWANGEALAPQAFSLASDTSMRLVVRPEGDAVPGMVRFRSNDIDAPGVELPILPPVEPLLHIEPSGLDFGQVRAGASATRTVRLINRGQAPLNIEGIMLSGPGFRVESPPLPVVLEPVDGPFGWLDLPVYFEPQRGGAAMAALRLETGATNAVVPLKGAGIDNQCPVAATNDSELTVAPLTVVALDGRASGDVDGPGGRPVRYFWSLPVVPVGALAAVAERVPDPTVLPYPPAHQDVLETSSAAFAPLLPGEYQAALTVEDQDGLRAPSAACRQPPATVRVTVRAPERGLFITVTTEQPSDEADLDLHLLRPRGDGWGQAPDDCFADNPEPEWSEDAEANPRLLRHGGRGPEVLHLPRPDRFDVAPDGYRIGVHAKTLTAPVRAQVQVYVDGRLRRSFSQILEAEGDFWVAAQVVGPGEINPIDEPIRALP